MGKKYNSKWMLINFDGDYNYTKELEINYNK